jgi:hypothetical protein
MQCAYCLELIDLNTTEDAEATAILLGEGEHTGDVLESSWSLFYSVGTEGTDITMSSVTSADNRLKKTAVHESLRFNSGESRKGAKHLTNNLVISYHLDVGINAIHTPVLPNRSI